MIGVKGKLATRQAAVAGMTIVLAGASLTTAAVATAATAGPARVVSRSAVVVKVQTHRPFGKILVTTHGQALYYLPHGSCTGQCLAIWPPLLMPSGKTVPKGAACLGTARFGTHHRLQVTYRRQRLYTFISDTGGRVTGNGVAGFKVAKVAAHC